LWVPCGFPPRLSGPFGLLRALRGPSLFLAPFGSLLWALAGGFWAFFSFFFVVLAGLCGLFSGPLLVLCPCRPVWSPLWSALGPLRACVWSCVVPCGRPFGLVFRALAGLWSLPFCGPFCGPSWALLWVLLWLFRALCGSFGRLPPAFLFFLSFLLFWRAFVVPRRPLRALSPPLLWVPFLWVLSVFLWSRVVPCVGLAYLSGPVWAPLLLPFFFFLVVFRGLPFGLCLSRFPFCGAHYTPFGFVVAAPKGGGRLFS